MRQLLLLSVLLCFGLHLSLKAQMPMNIQLALQDTLQDLGAGYKFKGLTVAVKNNYGSWASTYGESHAGTPLDTNMLIGIGSNTKTFISVCILKLVQNGQLSLNDSIGTYIPTYPNVNGAVTIKQLLNHTSGIASYTGNQNFWNVFNMNVSKLWSKDEILSFYVTTPSFAPGASWEYSNTNYLIAGLILENKLSKPVHEIIRDSILTPLGMTKTFFPPYETATQTYAHFWSDINGDNLLDEVCDWNSSGNSILPAELNSCADAAGALVSTPSDITRFWSGLMNGQLITKSTLVNEMLQWTSIGGTSSYGLGIFKDIYFGNVVFDHGGTWIGQIHSNVADTTRGIYISVLSNQDSLMNTYTDKVVKALYKTMLSTYPTNTTSVNSTATLTCYPNPVLSTLHLTSDEAIQYVTLHTITGKQVLESEFKNTLDISGLPSGIYLLKAQTEKGMLVKKITKSE